MKDHPSLRAAALLALMMLKGCGGGVDEHSPTSGLALASHESREALFAQDGQPSQAARQPPPGWGYRSRAGLYATRTQVEWEALTVAPYTVVVDVDAFSSPEAALAKTLADFRWSADGNLSAYYVHAADGARAVAVADALAEAGVRLVFVVTKGWS
jgi:rhodanese-related sulfurtransferase